MHNLEHRDSTSDPLNANLLDRGHRVFAFGMGGSHLLQHLRAMGAEYDGVSRQPPIATYDNTHFQLFGQSDFEF